jgi:antitoxin (DNA-binding transcriptional repressor) of toxin-antitoxin stability system
MLKGVNMETLIAMQDMRTELAAIADRAAGGEMFIVLRNSRPAFRIVPFNAPEEVVPQTKVKSFSDLRQRLDANPAGSDELSSGDLDSILKEVRSRRRDGA